MAEEVSAEILKRMRAAFMTRVNTDAEVRRFFGKLREKKAGQADVSLYAARLGELLSVTVNEVLTAAALPDDTLYFNIMRDTAGELLKDAHRAVNDAGIEAQRAIDERNGVGLAPVSAEFPRRRVNDLFYKAGAPGTTRDRALKTLAEPLVNVTQSFHDDHVRANAEARDRAGMEAKIVRTASFGCCEWCASLEGTYPYEDVADTGNDVFRRHERCRCTVDYVCDGRAQNVWTKRERPADDETLAARREYGEDADRADAGTLEARRAYGEQGERARPEEIEAAAERAREEKGLAFERESGIMNIGGSESAPDFYVGPNGKTLVREYKEWIGRNEMRDLLERSNSESARAYIRADFKPTSFIGDGSTAAIRRFEISTGLNCGRNGNSHAQKVQDLIRFLDRTKSMPDVTESDIVMLNEIRQKLVEVI